MDLKLRHTRLINKLIKRWNTVNEWRKPSKKEKKIISQLQQFSSKPLSIAIVGKANVGKSNFTFLIVFTFLMHSKIIIFSKLLSASKYRKIIRKRVKTVLK